VPTASFTHVSAASSVMSQAVGVADFHATLLQTLFDLRPRAMHQHQADAEAVQQREVVNQAGEVRVGNRLAGEADDEGAAAMRVDTARTGGSR